jgi:hypothetical protein
MRVRTVLFCLCSMFLLHCGSIIRFKEFNEDIYKRNQIPIEILGIFNKIEKEIETCPERNSIFAFDYVCPPKTYLNEYQCYNDSEFTKIRENYSFHYFRYGDRTYEIVAESKNDSTIKFKHDKLYNYKLINNAWITSDQ